MKKLIIAIIALVAGISAAAQDGRSVYNMYSDMEGVNAVYISPAMFRLIGKIPDLELRDGDVNLAPIIKSMKGFYIISTGRQDIGNSLYAEVEHYVKKGKYELLLEAKEDGETTRIYTVGSEEIVTGFVLLAKEAEEISFIAIDGEMEREKLEEVIANAARE